MGQIERVDEKKCTPIPLGCVGKVVAQQVGVSHIGARLGQIVLAVAVEQQIVSFFIEGYNASRVAVIAHVSSRLASLCASHKRVEPWREARSVGGVIAVVLLRYECLDAVDERVGTLGVLSQTVEESLPQHVLVVSRAVADLVHATLYGLQSRRSECCNRIVEPPQIAVFSRLVIVLFRVASLQCNDNDHHACCCSGLKQLLCCRVHIFIVHVSVFK